MLCMCCVSCGSSAGVSWPSTPDLTCAACCPVGIPNGNDAFPFRLSSFPVATGGHRGVDMLYRTFRQRRQEFVDFLFQLVPVYGPSPAEQLELHWLLPAKLGPNSSAPAVSAATIH